jgi:hypothetical protein
MQAREFLVAIVAVIIVAVIVAVMGGAVLLLGSLRRRNRSNLATARSPSPDDAPSAVHFAG